VIRFHIIVVPATKSIYAGKKECRCLSLFDLHCGSTTWSTAAMGTPDVPNSMLEAAVAQRSYPAGYTPDSTVAQTGGENPDSSGKKSSDAALIGGVTAGAFVIAAAFTVVGILAWRARAQRPVADATAAVETTHPSTPAQAAGQSFSSPRPSMRQNQSTQQPA
jgi:HAMP domain-containing protein